ncbi:hypothetical protein EG329_001340 [Mollisiaceae sp. DMI_Dod_QoI]|nr:hypothetical protein EG329_001340 [Helotiales sp. DMI_Dod_QoI]
MSSIELLGANSGDGLLLRAAALLGDWLRRYSGYSSAIWVWIANAAPAPGTPQMVEESNSRTVELPHTAQELARVGPWRSPPVITDRPDQDQEAVACPPAPGRPAAAPAPGIARPHTVLRQLTVAEEFLSF